MASPKRPIPGGKPALHGGRFTGLECQRVVRDTAQPAIPKLRATGWYRSERRGSDGIAPSTGPCCVGTELSDEAIEVLIGNVAVASRGEI